MMSEFIRFGNIIIKIPNINYIAIKNKGRIEVKVTGSEIVITGEEDVAKLLSALDIVVSDEEFEKYAKSTQRLLQNDY